MDWKGAMRTLLEKENKVEPIECTICQNGFKFPIVGKYDPNNMFSRKYNPKDPTCVSTVCFFVHNDGKVEKLPGSVFNTENRKAITGDAVSFIPYEEVNDYYESLSQ